jgi:two-component system, chemotaxis family, sensor kinase CheA
MEADSEIISEFLIESHENLGRLEGELVELESDPTATSILSSIFRTIHTIKGTCGFLGYRKLEAVAHAGESLLALLRDEELEYTSEIANGLLTMVDAIKEMLGTIESARSDGDDDHAELIAQLRRLQRGPGAAPAPPPPPRRPSVTLVPVPAPAPTKPPAPAPTTPAPTPVHAVADTSVRVDVGLLDKLMNLVGELVLARNQIVEHASTQTAATFLAATQRLNLITADLQEGVMKTRMQPIGHVFSKLPRFVRDLALACGKKIRVELEGEDTELDRTLLEAIKDPLAHLVRNSVDHGIEAPAARLAAGKPVEGTLRIRAFHAGGQVNVEISDDGNGIDCDKIRAKAVARGLITAELAERMGERELIGLIFLPGFSTATTVTNVSGRGVGMDVVKTNVERIGGLVDIESRRGVGTLFRIKIPLTLAIVPAVIVRTGEERYAIPQISLLEIVHLGSAGTAVEWIHGAPVYRLRGQLMPLVFLGQLLGGAPPADEAELNIVVLAADNRLFGLVVDDVDDTADIVVKPVGALLRGIAAYAGATILGDGAVALILDVHGIAKSARVLGDKRGAGAAADGSAALSASGVGEALVICTTVGDGQVALPLAAVARLEKIPVARVEHVGLEEVVQVRGDVLPLVRLESLLPDRSATPESAKDMLDVVVHSDGQRSIGLVVEQVLDIVHQEIVFARRGTRPGVRGTLVVKGRVTEPLDVVELLGTAATSKKTFEAA